MSDHRTIEWVVEIIGMCEPIRCVQGGMWFGHNHNFADATFVDYGAADAFAVAAGKLPALVAVVRQLVEAVDSGNLRMESPEIGEPENGIPYHPWHEELLHHARHVLGAVSAPSGSSK